MLVKMWEYFPVWYLNICKVLAAHDYFALPMWEASKHGNMMEHGTMWEVESIWHKIEPLSDSLKQFHSLIGLGYRLAADRSDLWQCISLPENDTLNMEAYEIDDMSIHAIRIHMTHPESSRPLAHMEASRLERPEEAQLRAWPVEVGDQCETCGRCMESRESEQMELLTSHSALCWAWTVKVYTKHCWKLQKAKLVGFSFGLFKWFHYLERTGTYCIYNTKNILRM